MVMFSDTFLRDLQDRLDIVSIVSSYVPLRQKGKRHWGCCPFHSEKTPSFSVEAEKQFFYCFGCHKGGDIFRFIQDIEKCDFMEAVEILAEKAGVELPREGDSHAYKQQQSQRKVIFEINRLAARFFHNNLMSNEGSAARKYLEDRGVNDKLIRRFGLGYSLNSWDALKNHLVEKGFEEQQIKKAGLVNSKDDKSYYDTFRERVIFPIIDTRDNVLGFGGRVMTDAMPKYINSQETAVYNKSNSLYGLHTVKRLRSIDRLLIVEGYMDVISMHVAGIPYVVASLGTALTEQQARLIRRFTPDIYIAYDGDAAGQKATLRGMDILNDQGLNVRVVTIPEGMDPDDYSKLHGYQGIIDLMDRALSLPDYKIGIIKSECDLNTLEGRNKYVQDSCRQVISRLDSPVMRSSYIKRLHEETGIDTNAIAEEVTLALSKQGMRKTYNNTNVPQAKPKPNPRDIVLNDDPDVMDEGLVIAEKYLIYVMLTSPSDGGVILSIINYNDFSTDERKAIVQLIGQKMKNGEVIDSKSIMLGVNSLAKGALAQILGQYDKNLDKEMLKDCLSRVMLARFDRQIEDITDLLRNNTMSKEDKTILYNQLNELMKKRKNLTK